MGLKLQSVDVILKDLYKVLMNQMHVDVTSPLTQDYLRIIYVVFGGFIRHPQ